MPRFVVLEHTWGGIHWDVMLEHKGVLATWAVDSAPADGACLPARRLADHRPAYLDYEGPVSGDRGAVRRVASGFYETVSWSADCVEVRLCGGQLSGPMSARRVESGPADGLGGWVLSFGK